jgi:hypothetical protein
MFEDVYRNLLVISIVTVTFAATLSVMREDGYQEFDAVSAQASAGSFDAPRTALSSLVCVESFELEHTKCT